MSEITSIRPYSIIHHTTGEPQYTIDIYRNDPTGWAPDEWYFGTNKQMWEEVIEAIKRTIT